MRYNPSIFRAKRWKTREVMVGNVGVGGDNPVRIQSMTTSDTRDVEATIEQVLRLEQAGCEIARLTVQGKKEADACESIKNGLIKRGCTMPLVADIHFYPPAAMRVVDSVDKVRINPGNFADRRASFVSKEFSDEGYKDELERIRDKFSPLVEKCIKLKRAMRIGTNHGSLSDRIMTRFGDSPQGMVESAIEYAQICVEMGYHDFVFSMKSSNPVVMVQAYRLLAAKMMEMGWAYPLHLGVTEAGEGEDGRVKSAMGIGTLLLDGLGDTIRVSLTEDPWYEIDPCQRLVNFAQKSLGKGIPEFQERHRDIAHYGRRPAPIEERSPLHRDGSVLLPLTEADLLRDDIFNCLGFGQENGEITKEPSTVDMVVLKERLSKAESKEIVQKLVQTGLAVASEEPMEGCFHIRDLAQLSNKPNDDRFSAIPGIGSSKKFQEIFKVFSEDGWEHLKKERPAFILFEPSTSRLHLGRKFFDWLQEENLDIPVIHSFSYDCSREDFAIQSAAEMGSLLCDGLGDGVLLQGPYGPNGLRQIGFQILQAARMRSFKTEFISCPSCGRTLFDLQSVSERIRSRTSHLPGVKIAIMGCIVNGPGEMADADFGYVGSAPKMVDLYVGKECVEKNIPHEEADDRLIELIKIHGRWEEPRVVEEAVMV